MFTEPSDEDIRNACMCYTHDFGLLSESDQAYLCGRAKAWLYAWEKVLKDKQTAIDKIYG